MAPRRRALSPPSDRIQFSTVSRDNNPSDDNYRQRLWLTNRDIARFQLGILVWFLTYYMPCFFLCYGLQQLLGVRTEIAKATSLIGAIVLSLIASYGVRRLRHRANGPS